MKVRRDTADALFSKLVRERAEWRCERCGRTDGKLDCSHIQPRDIKILRFDPANGMCLCFRCHRWWHSNPSESGVWCRNVIGEERYAYLLAKKLEPFKFDRATQAHVRKMLQVSLDDMRGCRESGVTGRIEFSSPYEGEILPLARKPRKPKAKKAPKKKIQSPGFDKTKTVKLRTREVVARDGTAVMR